MKVLGWRFAFDSSPWGLYMPPPECKNDPEMLEAWKEYIGNIKKIQVSDSTDFSNLRLIFS
jgi:hypothetical protein